VKAGAKPLALLQVLPGEILRVILGRSVDRVLPDLEVEAWLARRILARWWP
jgi:hypothetical protein